MHNNFPSIMLINLYHILHYNQMKTDKRDIMYNVVYTYMYTERTNNYF